MSNNFYFNKYTKYKNKYLNLKKISKGGAEKKKDVPSVESKFETEARTRKVRSDSTGSDVQPSTIPSILSSNSAITNNNPYLIMAVNNYSESINDDYYWRNLKYYYFQMG